MRGPAASYIIEEFGCQGFEKTIIKQELRAYLQPVVSFLLSLVPLELGTMGQEPPVNILEIPASLVLCFEGTQESGDDG